MNNFVEDGVKYTQFKQQLLFDSYHHYSCCAVCLLAARVQVDLKATDVKQTLMTALNTRVKTILPVLMALIVTPVPVSLDTQVFHCTAVLQCL